MRIRKVWNPQILCVIYNLYLICHLFLFLLLWWFWDHFLLHPHHYCLGSLHLHLTLEQPSSLVIFHLLFVSPAPVPVSILSLQSLYLITSVLCLNEHLISPQCTQTRLLSQAVLSTVFWPLSLSTLLSRQSETNRTEPHHVLLYLPPLEQAMSSTFNCFFSAW